MTGENPAMKLKRQRSQMEFFVSIEEIRRYCKWSSLTRNELLYLKVEYVPFYSLFKNVIRKSEASSGAFVCRKMRSTFGKSQIFRSLMSIINARRSLLSLNEIA